MQFLIFEDIEKNFIYVKASAITCIFRTERNKEGFSYIEYDNADTVLEVKGAVPEILKRIYAAHERV